MQIEENFCLYVRQKNDFNYNSVKLRGVNGNVKVIFMFLLCETYVSQGRAVRFPHGKRMVPLRKT